MFQRSGLKSEKKKKIAVLGQKSVPSRRGGIEQVVTNMYPIITEHGYQVTCYNRRGECKENEYGEIIRERYYQGILLKTVPAIKKRGLSAVTSSFFAAVFSAAGKYDIVHFHAEGPCAMIWIPKLFGKKCIATVHGLDWQRDKWKNSLGTGYIKLGEKIMVRWADEIIVLSENIKNYFSNTYGRECTYIPNGVALPKRRPANIIEEKFGVTQNSYYCTLSRLAEEKGIHYLIRAYQNLSTDKKLVIAGHSGDSDDYVRQLKEIASGNPNIIFTGFVTGELLAELYSNAYVYILPSNLEGMPLTLLEAMSYGCCVIGSDIPEIMEVVEDKAVIFRKGDEKDLTRKMQMLEDQPEIVEEYRKHVAEFITQKYSWKKTADMTIALYDKVMGMER